MIYLDQFNQPKKRPAQAGLFHALKLRVSIGDAFALHFFQSSQNIAQLFSADLFADDLLVLVQQKHLRRRKHVKGGAEIELFRVVTPP